MMKIEMGQKRKLSKAILEMKFMKKTKDKEEKQREIEESEAIFADQITAEMKSGGDMYIIEPSMARCKELISGRLSFNGMNPEIERQMELDKEKENPKQQPIEVQQSADISDAEMANYSLHTVKAIAKRFMTKSERQIKRPKFLKPVD